MIRDFGPDFEEKEFQDIPHKNPVFKGRFFKIIHYLTNFCNSNKTGIMAL